LIERGDIGLNRVAYLLAVKKCREEGLPFVNEDETFIYRSHTRPKN
jgi:hypothetical protein